MLNDVILEKKAQKNLLDPSGLVLTLSLTSISPLSDSSMLTSGIGLNFTCLKPRRGLEPNWEIWSQGFGAFTLPASLLAILLEFSQEGYKHELPKAPPLPCEVLEDSSFQDDCTATALLCPHNLHCLVCLRTALKVRLNLMVQVSEQDGSNACW